MVQARPERRSLGRDAGRSRSGDRSVQPGVDLADRGIMRNSPLFCRLPCGAFLLGRAQRGEGLRLYRLGLTGPHDTIPTDLCLQLPHLGFQAALVGPQSQPLHLQTVLIRAIPLGIESKRAGSCLPCGWQRLSECLGGDCRDSERKAEQWERQNFHRSNMVPHRRIAKRDGSGARQVPDPRALDGHVFQLSRGRHLIFGQQLKTALGKVGPHRIADQNADPSCVCLDQPG